MARILLAEDDETIRGLIERALRQDGHHTIASADGKQALRKLDDEDGAFDLLLADIKMPTVDGIELAMTAGRDYPDVIVLLMTGYADMRERAHRLEPFVHDVIAKPFSADQICGAVGEALALRS